MNLSRSKTVAPNPPDNGSFALDHFRECREAMAEYMACLKENGMDTTKCAEFGREYLECRMDKGLMAKTDADDLMGTQKGVSNTGERSTESL